jgi:hypothetical protein
MKTNTCGTTQNDWCDSGYAERPRYYPRQLITPDDLTLGVEYLLKLQRRHNRLLHGWGVVCGAEVAPVVPATGTGTARPWKVVVRPGYILDPFGREILIDTEVCLDLRRRCVTGVTGESCGEKVDPWCSDVYVKPETGGPLYVAVQYKQVQSRPVRVQPVGCGCDDTACEFSRWRDAYEICTLTELPESHTQDPPAPGERPHGLPDCPGCPDEPWVVLAEVQIDEDGELQYIDNCSRRRLVRSFAAEWWRCESLATEPVQVSLSRGTTNQTIAIAGLRLVKEMRVLLPKGVTESADRTLTVQPSGAMTLTLTVDVDASAEPGSHPVLVVHPDGSARRGTLTIVAAGDETAARPASPITPGTKAALRRPRRER